MIRVYLTEGSRTVDVPCAKYFETDGGSLVLYVDMSERPIALFPPGKWDGCERLVYTFPEVKA